MERKKPKKLLHGSKVPILRFLEILLKFKISVKIKIFINETKLAKFLNHGKYIFTHFMVVELNNAL